MTIIDIAREQAREGNGQFGTQDHTVPEIGLSIGQAQSLLAANAINYDAPIGAVRATVYLDELSGKMKFSRYIDRNGVSVVTDCAEDFDDFLDGANPDHFAQQPGITRHDIDGQAWFEIELED